MGDILIKKVTNNDDDFYTLIGPYLARRSIAKELGGNVWDDDGKVWYVALMDGKVCGFVAALYKQNKVTFCSDYILPEFRNAGIYNKLFATRLSDCKDNIIMATATPLSLNHYLNNGFVVTGARGRYRNMKREPK